MHRNGNQRRSMYAGSVDVDANDEKIEWYGTKMPKMWAISYFYSI